MLRRTALASISQGLRAQRSSGRHAWYRCMRRARMYERLPCGAFSARPSLSDICAHTAVCAFWRHTGVAALYRTSAGSLERAGDAARRLHPLITRANGGGAEPALGRNKARALPDAYSQQATGSSDVKLVARFGSCAAARLQRRRSINSQHYPRPKTR